MSVGLAWVLVDGTPRHVSDFAALPSRRRPRAICPQCARRVIVGHRFSAEEKYLLAVEADEKADTPVILVCGAAPDSEIPATSRVYALEGNTGLLSALSRLFPVEAARPQTAA